MSSSAQDPASQAAQLRLTRPLRLADLVWPYQILVDGENAGEIKTRMSLDLPISAGTHTLQLRSLHAVNRRLGLTSRNVSFDAPNDQTAEFVCHARAFATSLFWWIACLLGDRDRWIVLEPETKQRVGTRIDR